MAHSKLFSWLRPSVARPQRRFDGKLQRYQRRVPVRLHLESLEDRVVPATIVTLPLDNQTGLNPAQFSIYVFGYGQAGNGLPATELQSNGQFADIPANSSGTIHSYNLSTMPAITLSSAIAVNSGIVYFVVVPNGQAPPTLTYTADSNDVLTINSGLPSNPPFAIVELTEPADGTNYPTIDDSVVDNFSLPLTVTLNDNLGQVGQPAPNPAVNRESILDAYTSFMNAQGTAGTPYLNLVYASNSIAGQAGGIVNPTLYLASPTTPSNDPLNSVWDNTLNQLFGTTTGGGGMTLHMIGDDNDYYVGTPTNESFGGKTYRVLDFVGYKTAAENTIPNNTNGNEFWVFDPLTPDPNGSSYKPNESAGEMVFGGDNVFNDYSANVLVQSSGPIPTTVAKGLERDINAALNRGVALHQTDGSAGSNSIYWGTETNWYPAGQTENLYSLFMHTATINGTPIFTLPSGAVRDAQGTLMAQAYGFAFDENPTHGPAGQPNVPSKFDPVPNGTTTATITLGPWFQPPSPPQSSSSSSSSSNSSSANASPFELVTVFILAQDEFTFLVDGMLLRFTNNPMFTQAADRGENLLNDLIFVDNPALFTGLEGLQSAIYANPYCDTLWAYLAEAVALDSAAGVFAG